VAVWAFLDITAWKMKLAIADAALITCRRGGSPTEAFFSVFDSSERLPANKIVRHHMRTFGFC
jgi:hypothetical protein